MIQFMNCEKSSHKPEAIVLLPLLERAEERLLLYFGLDLGLGLLRRLVAAAAAGAGLLLLLLGQVEPRLGLRLGHLGLGLRWLLLPLLRHRPVEGGHLGRGVLGAARRPLAGLVGRQAVEPQVRLGPLAEEPRVEAGGRRGLLLWLLLSTCLGLCLCLGLGLGLL